MPQVKLRLLDGREAWEPGELLSGTISLQDEQEWKAEYIDVVAWWSTSGKGEQDTGIVHRENLVQKGEGIPGRKEISFRIKLPKAPWTYHGRLIKIDWYVGAYVRECGKAEDAVMTPIRVFPGGGREHLPADVRKEHDDLLPDAPPPDVF